MSVKLGSNLSSIFLVSYLPTILINIINQATNYLDTDLLITVNVTCMMVLFSVYLTVSSSLPATPGIKPIEVWLLFNSGNVSNVQSASLLEKFWSHGHYKKSFLLKH